MPKAYSLEGICDGVICILGVIVPVEQQWVRTGAPRILTKYVVLVYNMIYQGGMSIYRVSNSPNGDPDTLRLVQASFDNL